MKGFTIFCFVMGIPTAGLSILFWLITLPAWAFWHAVTSVLHALGEMKW
jgi:hypothetical protein